MEKTAAYLAIAILLGTVAVLPVLVFTPKMSGQGCYTFLQDDMYLRGRADVESLQTLEDADAAVVLSTPLNTGLIFAISFVSAFGVSLYFKRRIQ
ncbi:MAG: hypothetical protein JSV57_00485 [Candidatus Bathyarchaeota archaeon]|nr:MAG: hypothetical protein JSV57_00485 [Candidatus Bathyarchaeota archaeon]